MHRRLCVFQKQAKVPATTLKHLWELESDGYARIVAMRRVQVGLASKGYEQAGSERIWHMTVHDALHDFAVNEARRHGEVPQAHESLLKGYRQSRPELWSAEENRTKWWSPQLEADGYIHRNLCRHLKCSGRVAELVELLNAPEWTARRLQMKDILALEADCALGIESVKEWNKDDGSDNAKAFKLFCEAAKLSAGFVAANPDEVMFQLYGRLVEWKSCCDVIKRYLDRIERAAPRPWLQSINSFLAAAGGATMRMIFLHRKLHCLSLIDGEKRAACGCSDGAVVLLDLARGETEREWRAHDQAVEAVAVGKGGKRLLTGSKDKTVKVWDLKKETCVACCNGHSRIVSGLAVMGDGQRVVSGSADGSVRVWDTESGRLLGIHFRYRHTVPAPTKVEKLGHGGEEHMKFLVSHGMLGSSALSEQGKKPVMCTAAFPDGHHVVWGGRDKALQMYNLTTGARVGGPFEGHEDSVACLAVTADGQRIVSGSGDKTVRMWCVASGVQIGDPLRGHTRWVQCVAVSKDGRVIVSGGGDCTLRVWDGDSGQQMYVLEGHTNLVSDVQFLANDDVVLSCSLDGSVRMWDLRRMSERKAAARHEREVQTLEFSADGMRAVSSSSNTLWTWDGLSGQPIGSPLEGHEDQVRGVAVTPDGSGVVSVSDDRTVRLWDMHSGKQIRELRGHTDWVRWLALTPLGDRAVSGSDDCTVRVWDLAAGDGTEGDGCGFALDGKAILSIHRVFVSDDGLRVVSAGHKNEIMTWDIESRRCVRRETREDVGSLSREEIMNVVGESCAGSRTMLPIRVSGREIWWGEGEAAVVLGCVEGCVGVWSVSRDQKKLGVGFRDGRVALMNIVT